MLQARVLSIKKKLFFYDYSRLSWATRTLLTAIVSLCISYYAPQEGFWLISSSFIMVQLFSFAPPSFSKTTMLIYGIALASLSTLVSYFAHWPLFSWISISVAIFTAFFFFHKGITVAMISMWSMVMVVLNICLPQDHVFIMPHLLTNFSGILIAYGATFIVLPKRKKDKPSAHMKSLTKLLQHDADSIFQKAHHHPYPSAARIKLLSGEKTVNATFATHYTNIVYLLASIDRQPSSASQSDNFFQECVKTELCLLTASFS